jgi:hypothetical protein
MYNDSLALMLCMIAYYVMDRNTRFGWLVGIILGLAVGIRSTSIIFVVAILLVEYKNIKNCIICTIVILIVYKLSMNLAVNYVNSIIGEIENVHWSVARWLVIGLRDTVMGPGWITYDLSNISINELKELIIWYIQNPLEYLSFHMRKITSACTLFDLETFGGIRNCITRYTMEDWFKQFFYDKNIYYAIVMYIMNLMLSITYVGSAMYLKFKEHKNLKELFGIIVFIGVMIFHSFWEIKGRYMVIGVMMLTPYAWSGIKLARRKMKLWHGIVLSLLVIALSFGVRHIVVNSENNIRILNNIETYNNDSYNVLGINLE